MYVGHAALALAAKSRAPTIPIAVLTVVAFAPDWIEVTLTASGWDRYRATEASHSILAVLGGASIAMLACWLLVRDRRAPLVVGALYASHWVADFFTGYKPTWPGSPWVGLQLYGRPRVDSAIEVVLILVCWWIYESSLPPKVRERAVGLLIPGGLVAMQFAFYALAINLL